MGTEDTRGLVNLVVRRGSRSASSGFCVLFEQRVKVSLRCGWHWGRIKASGEQLGQGLEGMDVS